MTIICEVCGKEFRIRPSEEGGRYTCSTACGYKRLTKYKFGIDYSLNEIGVSRSTNQKNLRYRYRLAVLDKLGNKCVQCGFTDLRALQIDHVNGGGKKERREINNTTIFYRKVSESTDKGEGLYQLLCANCNVIKHITNGEHKNNIK